MFITLHQIDKKNLSFCPSKALIQIIHMSESDKTHEEIKEIQKPPNRHRIYKLQAKNTKSMLFITPANNLTPRLFPYFSSFLSPKTLFPGYSNKEL